MGEVVNKESGGSVFLPHSASPKFRSGTLTLNSVVFLCAFSSLGTFRLNLHLIFFFNALLTSLPVSLDYFILITRKLVFLDQILKGLRNLYAPNAVLCGPLRT